MPSPAADHTQTTSSTTKPPKTTAAPSSEYHYPVTGHVSSTSMDNGVDFEGAYPGTVVAIDSGVITTIHMGFVSGGDALVLQMDHPWHGYKWIYYGHISDGNFKPAGGGRPYQAGDRVVAGQHLADTERNPPDAAGMPGHVEIGFATSAQGGLPLGRAADGNRGAAAPQAAKDFNNFISHIKNHTAVPGGSGSGSTGGDAAQVATVAKAASFATYLEVPGLFDTVESLALRGQKSLMNDKPLLPFIEQLCTASLRNFMSMPNGNFYAFFPDYFGGLSNRTAYWHIEDIEIMDGQIELSDDSLATHVYIVGDTAAAFGEINIVDKLQSGGVVTVFNAFMADFINGLPEPGTAPIRGQTGTKAQTGESWDPNRPNLANKDRAITFLQKYGARPYYEEAPMVRSPYFEAFLAYQKFCLLWARQFLTTFTLTFMPEIFPGGIIAFPDHGLQCYVDEVVHNCSYESGFTTQVNLSAPSALKDNQGHPIDPNRAWVHSGMIRAFALGDDRPDVSGQPVIPAPKKKTTPAPTSRATRPG